MIFNHSIINAAKAAERSESVSRNFHDLGIEPNFFEAIMGNELNETQLKECRGDNGLLTIGEVGCVLSHLKVCKDFLSTNAPYWTIFEDDIHLSNEFLDAYPRIESFMNSQIEPSVLLLRRNNGKGKVVYPLGGNHHVLHMLAGTMSCGYIINRKAAENLVKALIPVRIEYDAWAIYQQLGYIKLYSTDFNYVELNPTMSSNSIIDQMEKRYDDSCQFPKKIKDGNVKALYNQNSPSQKIILQLKRVVRHLQELYYDEYRY